MDYVCIIECDIQDDKLHLIVEDGFHQECFEYYLNPSNVEVKILRTYNE